MRKLKKSVQKKWDRRKNFDTDMRKRGYITPAEAAEMAKVSASTVYGWVHRRKLVDVPEGRTVAVAVRNVNGVLWISKKAVAALCPDLGPVRA